MANYFDNNFTNVFVDGNYCYGPSQFNPAILPVEIKKQVTEKLTLAMTKPRQNIKKIVRLKTFVENINDLNTLAGGPSTLLTHRRQFIADNARYDQLRNQKFSQTYPQLHQLCYNERFLNDITY